MMVLPVLLYFWPNSLSDTSITFLYTVSLAAVFWVMAIRPLADLFPELPWLRALVVLRKGMGVLSASIIVSFMLAKFMTGGFAYLENFTTASYWSMNGWAILAHLGDVTAVILLITSNKLSKRLLGSNWKRIQKLAYVYFYAGAGYEMLVFGSMFAFVAVIVVTVLVGLARIKNSMKVRLQTA